MTSPYPWLSDRPLDAARVERIVDARFPALRPAHAVFLDQGWDSEVYAVGEWILRFPKRGDVIPSQRLERVLLSHLAPRLPIPIPSPELFGEPADDFPFPFLGYRRLPGVAAVHVPPDAVDVPVLARRLSAFVTALHAIHPADVPGVPTHPPRDRLKDRYRERWHDVRGILPAAIASRGDAFFAAPSPAEAAITLRLVHADVTYDHVLLQPDGSDVAGVIDWGDLAFADPAWDFAGMFAWFGEAFARRMMDAYGVDVDADLFERSRRGGIYCSVSALWWGQAGGRPRDVAAGTRGLELTLPPV